MRLARPPSSASPSSANTIWATVCNVVLAVIAAAASGVGTPRWISWRIIKSGPPIWPAGIRLLADSPIQRTSSALSVEPPRARVCNMRMAAASRASGSR